MVHRKKKYEMMKRYILALLLLSLVVAAQGQQTALYSQYMTNYYLINPAASGSDADLSLNVGYRNQWVGFEGAPVTTYLSAHSALSPKKRRSFRRKKSQAFHAVGGHVYTDKAGPNSRTGINGSYAYHLPINSQISHSVGVSLGVQQWAFNVNKLHLADDSNDQDPVTLRGSQQSFLPDINVGYYLHAKEFYAGLSLAQAIGFQIFDYESDVTESGNRLYRHLFLSGGYNYVLNKQITIAPSTLVKYTPAAPIQADLNVKAIYNFNNRLRSDFDDEVWLGLSFRTGDALIGLFGLQFMERYQLSYAYDFTISDIRKYSGGSHEIVMGIRLSL